LKELESSKTETAANVSPKGAPDFEVKTENINKPILDVGMATKTISLTFGGFIGSLLALDIWYSKKKGILKFTGHTFAHLTLLAVVIFCVWFVLKPGLII